MDASSRYLDTTATASDPRSFLRWAGIIFAIAFPSFFTWVYLNKSEGFSPGVRQTVYLIGKCIQFAFPVVWTALVLREKLRTGRPTKNGVLIGIAFGAAVLAAGIALFYLALSGLPVFEKASVLIQKKIVEFGIDTSTKYFVLSGFYSIFHSLLEEYYFRWFVFRQLRFKMALWPAVIISAIAFTLHHIVVLALYFPETPWLIALLAGATAIGGAFWAWLYDRSDSIFDTWPSHLLIDVGVFFAVGYPLVRHLFTGG